MRDPRAPFLMTLDDHLPMPKQVFVAGIDTGIEIGTHPHLVIDALPGPRVAAVALMNRSFQFVILHTSRNPYYSDRYDAITLQRVEAPTATAATAFRLDQEPDLKILWVGDLVMSAETIRQGFIDSEVRVLRRRTKDKVKFSLETLRTIRKKLDCADLQIGEQVNPSLSAFPMATEWRSLVNTDPSMGPGTERLKEYAVCGTHELEIPDGSRMGETFKTTLLRRFSSSKAFDEKTRKE